MLRLQVKEWMSVGACVCVLKKERSCWLCRPGTEVATGESESMQQDLYVCMHPVCLAVANQLANSQRETHTENDTVCACDSRGERGEERRDKEKMQHVLRWKHGG